MVLVGGRKPWTDLKQEAAGFGGRAVWWPEVNGWVMCMPGGGQEIG